MEIGMPTIVIQHLYRNSDRSILFIFHPTGSFLSGCLQERYGRKRCMILANVPSIFGWILLYYTHSTVSLYSSTVLMGLGIGFSEAPILSYIGEITEPRLRGSMALLACTSSMFGNRRIAEYTLSDHVNMPCDFDSRVSSVAGFQSEKRKSRKFLVLVNRMAELKEPSVYRPFIFIMFYFLISDIVSSVPWRPYTSKIVTEVGISNNQSLFLVVFAVLQTIGSLIVVLTVHYLVIIWLKAIKNGYIYSTPWIPITILCGINFFGASVIILPWMLLSEVFPNK
ncbi:unnamed protein product [Macrosiphum euphorbiae]|uniref:Facilitated trehalose transporter Tret1 n=1 Tax=Macrosiphum euphorbiae TaxID=13131 RepID=A0AAV0Y605_9HEMI|nr:unnamed protein product [Macrosiphum euphorbiae]